MLAQRRDRARRPHPRPRPLRPRQGRRRGRRPRAVASSRARRTLGVVLPVELAGRAFAVGAGDRPEDGARPEAGQRRALDALPAHPGLHQGGRAARGLRLLPHRPRGRGRDPAPHAAAASSSATWPRRRPGRRTRGSRCTAPATARSCSAPTPSADWTKHLDVMVSSIVENGGRSCVNASGVWVHLARPRDRRGAGRAAGPDPSAGRRRSRGPARALRQPRGGDAASPP